MTKDDNSKNVFAFKLLFSSKIFLLHEILNAYMFCCFSCVRLFATLWTVAQQATLSLGLSRQEYWSGLPYPPFGGLPNPGIKIVSPVSSALQADYHRASGEAPKF